MDLDFLSKLIPILKSHNVSSFKTQGIELAFYPGSPQEKQEVSSPGPASEQPTDLGSVDGFNFDDILNWSASPDKTPQDMPLTGDTTLEV